MEREFVMAATSPEDRPHNDEHKYDDAHNDYHDDDNDDRFKCEIIGAPKCPECPEVDRIEDLWFILFVLFLSESLASSNWEAEVASGAASK